MTNLAHLAVDPSQGFWAVYVNTHLGATVLAPAQSGLVPTIGIWQLCSASAGPDSVWLRLAGSTHGASLIVFATLLSTGVLSSSRTWRLSDPACATESLSMPILEPEHE